MIFSFKLVLSSLVFSLLIISCQEPKHTEESVEIVPKDTIKEEVFPKLGHDAPYYADSVYYGREKYIEYFAGNLPIILSVPHGGREIPSEIPDRSWGTMVTDDNTYEMSKVIMDTMEARFGARPHVILCRLKRRKLDANRDSLEAAQENRFAHRAWQEYHYYIGSAKKKIESEFGSGLFLDIHGHGANPDGYYDLRTWLGYLMPGSVLDRSDEELNTTENSNKTSIRALVDSSSFSFIEVLRGKNSFGSLMDSLRFYSVPSKKYPGPEGSRYFSGGYNTLRHGSRDGGMISAIQIEAPKPGIREDQQTWSKFASALTTVVDEYYFRHIGRRIKN
jgi:hypothetical protein